MGSRKILLLFWFVLMWPTNTTDLDAYETEFSIEDRWTFRNERKPVMANGSCLDIHPTNRDIIKRFTAILPYFDKGHSNAEFLRRYRASMRDMSESNLLDREAAYYATVLTSLVFLQGYRDTWCLIERFHRALRLYQVSHPTEKRTALKLLQNFRAVNQKIRNFVRELPGPASARTTTTTDFNDEEFHDKRDIIYLKEFIKNLG